MPFERLNAYKVMWVLVLFDLPTETAKERKIYAQFRKKILDFGFVMFQFSIYMRHCPSRENADKHIAHVKKIMPDRGHIGILTITDKQFGDMEIFSSGKSSGKPDMPQQLELF